ncbi:hypothetical protein PSCLAVI8L_180235 [Pseudoclavibacter sp. 8L]|nr:hypothetical protein PSCLAVI8L_180235 [Pseudoclavibacter sp. 8L]
MRLRALQGRNEVRLRMRVAELLRVGPPRRSPAARGPLARHGAHRGALRELRVPPRARLPRRLRHPDGRPLLHELALALLHTGRRDALRVGRASPEWPCGAHLAHRMAMMVPLRLQQADLAQLVEHRSCKADVASSNLAVGSRILTAPRESLVASVFRKRPELYSAGCTSTRLRSAHRALSARPQVAVCSD